MELPVRVVRGQRVLLAVLLAPVLAVAWLEFKSVSASAIRHDKPIVYWLALRAQPAALAHVFMLLYRPDRRTLDLVDIPEDLPLSDRNGGKEMTSISRLAAASRRRARSPDSVLAATVADETMLAISADSPQALRDAFVPEPFIYENAGSWSEEAPLEAKEWLLEQLHPASLVRRLLSVDHVHLGTNSFELLRLGIELNRLKNDDIRAGYLPETPAERASFLAKLIEPAGDIPTIPEEHQVTVEILNATEKPGVASALKKILRSKGADVMSTGNAPARARTVVYDRVGRPELAAQVRRMLKCESARALTQIDAKRLVDVSVVIADDCPQRE